MGHLLPKFVYQSIQGYPIQNLDVLESKGLNYQLIKISHTFAFCFAKCKSLYFFLIAIMMCIVLKCRKLCSQQEGLVVGIIPPAPCSSTKLLVVYVYFKCNFFVNQIISVSSA